MPVSRMKLHMRRMIAMSQRHTVGHIFGATFGAHAGVTHDIAVIGMAGMRQRHATVGHIFGASFGTHAHVV